MKDSKKLSTGIGPKKNGPISHVRCSMVEFVSSLEVLLRVCLELSSGRDETAEESGEDVVVMTDGGEVVNHSGRLHVVAQTRPEHTHVKLDYSGQLC